MLKNQNSLEEKRVDNNSIYFDIYESSLLEKESLPNIEDFINKYKENNILYFDLYIEITKGNHDKAKKLYDECVNRELINKQNSSCSSYENFIKAGYDNYYSDYRMFCDEIFKKEYKGGYCFVIKEIINDNKSKEKYIKFLRKQKNKKIKDIENIKIKDYDEDFKQFKENIKNISLLEKELEGKIKYLKYKNARIEHKYHEFTLNSYREDIFEKYFIERIKYNKNYIHRNYKSNKS